jgi:hypothetical protein
MELQSWCLAAAEEIKDPCRLAFPRHVRSAWSLYSTLLRSDFYHSKYSQSISVYGAMLVCRGGLAMTLNRAETVAKEKHEADRHLPHCLTQG